MHSDSTRGALVLIAGAATAALALTSCAAPETRFVASSEHDVVVQVPWDWKKITRDEVLEARPGKASKEKTPLPEGTWIEFYDGARHPAAAHLLQENVDEPVVVLQSVAVDEENRAALTTDALRDFFRPVTESARTQNAAMRKAGGLEPEHFALDSDEEIITDTARGVHVVYRYGEGPLEEVYDQAVATDPERERLHVLIVHCSAACYAQRRQQIAAITDSFTIKKS